MSTYQPKPWNLNQISSSFTIIEGNPHPSNPKKYNKPRQNNPFGSCNPKTLTLNIFWHKFDENRKFTQILHKIYRACWIRKHLLETQQKRKPHRRKGSFEEIFFWPPSIKAFNIFIIDTWFVYPHWDQKKKKASFIGSHFRIDQFEQNPKSSPPFLNFTTTTSTHSEFYISGALSYRFWNCLK